MNNSGSTEKYSMKYVNKWSNTHVQKYIISNVSMLNSKEYNIHMFNMTYQIHLCS